MNIDSLVHLWNMTQQQLGTSGARVAAGVLLGLYNGERFPLDLTELRALDADNLKHAINVIESDASHCQMEVHEHLNRLASRRDFGERFEWLAHDFNTFKRGRCRKHELHSVVPARLVLHMPTASPEAGEKH